MYSMVLQLSILQISGDVEYLANELVGALINSSNSNNWIQYFLTLAVIATAFITYWYSRKNHDQLEREMKIRLRPVLARLHSMDKKSPMYGNNGWVEGESYRYNSEKLSIHFINNGSLPATSISYKYYVEIRQGDHVSDKILQENITLTNLSIHEHYSIDLPWTATHGFNASNAKKCYFGLEIKYGFKDSKDLYIYLIEGFVKNNYLIIEKSDIT